MNYRRWISQLRSLTVQFRLLSYNIHKGIGGIDRKYRPERIKETIEHYNADLILLQEVDDGVPRSNHHRQVDWLGDALGFKYRAFQSNVTLRQGTYGNAILSRMRFDDGHDIDLAIPLKKRRRALTMRVHFPSSHGHRSLVVANVHLGLSGIERKIQLRRLLDHHVISSLRRATPVIIGGDFNDVWGQLGRSTVEPRGFMSAFHAAKTFPAAFPLRSLDRVFYRGDIRLIQTFVGHTDIARQASDHLPIVADFEI